MYELLVANGVGIWQIQIVTSMGNMAENKGYLLAPEKVGKITAFICQKHRMGSMQVIAGDNIGYFDESEVYIRSRPGTIAVWGGCKAGIRVVGIDSVGNVKGCESIYSENSSRETCAMRPSKRYGKRKATSLTTETSMSACSPEPAPDVTRDTFAEVVAGASSYFNSGSLFESRYCSYPGRPGCCTVRAQGGDCFSREEAPEGH